MAVPKKRTSSMKRDQRRSHDGLSKLNISFDKNTGEPKLPHHVSLNDGYYNGMVVLKNKQGDRKNKRNKKKDAESA
jgi:large subunit ribosomal protein L32